MLLDHAKKSPQSEKTTKTLKKGKQYLKTKYPLNYTNAHNINFALSDLKNKKLQVPSEQVMMRLKKIVLNYGKQLMLLE